MQLTEQQQDKLSKVQLEESWKRSLAPFLLSPQMDSLRDFLFQQKQAQKIIYPPSKQIFNALNTTAINQPAKSIDSSKWNDNKGFNPRKFI